MEFNEIRLWFAGISCSVKLNYYCKLLGINSSNLSKFILGYDKAVQYDKLVSLRDLIKDDLIKKIA